MKKKTAVVFGSFAPLHQGHIDLIQRAKRQCDQVWVVVSGYEGDRGEQVGLTLQKRFRYIREAFGDDELTSVCKLDEPIFLVTLWAGRSGWIRCLQRSPMMKPSKN